MKFIFLDYYINQLGYNESMVYYVIIVFDPEGPLWIQVVDPENPEELSDDNLGKENAENEHNNALNAMKAHDGEDELEPPSPSKPAYENTACLQKKRINK